MNYRISALAGTSLAAILAVSMVVMPAAFATAHEGTYLDIVSAEVQEKDDSVKLELYTAEDAAAGVPSAYGYVALTEDGQDMLAVTTHFGVVDENPESTEDTAFFHTHIVDIVGSCEEGVQVSADPDAVGEFKIDGTEIKVTDVDSSLVGELTGTVASFTIHLEGSNVCVVPIEAEASSD